MNLTHDKAVGHHDDDERQCVDGGNVEQVVDELVGRRGEKVERDALSEPREIRVVLHVKYRTLQNRRERHLSVFSPAGALPGVPHQQVCLVSVKAERPNYPSRSRARQEGGPSSGGSGRRGWWGGGGPP